MFSLAELVKEVLIAQSGMVSSHRTIFNYSLGDLDGLHDISHDITFHRCSMGIFNQGASVALFEFHD